jgi:PAS domain S-box-containing protein
MVEDISARKQAAEALQLSEQHLKSIIETSPECVKLVAADGTLLQINAAGLAMVGAERAEDVIGQSVYPLVASSHREAFRAMTERVCRGHKEVLEFEVVGLRGTQRWMETHAVPLRNPNGGAVVLLAITRDITERKHAEEALRRHERTLQRARDERERISQDLHDNILQSLYAVGMQLEASKLSFSKTPRKSKSYTMQAIDQLNRLVVDVRQFIALLKQPTAPAMDFGQALRQLVAAFSAAGQAAPELEVEDLVEPRVTSEQAEQLLNIAREALSNSLRHAQATHRRVRLSHSDHTLRMQICDDGVGFDPHRKGKRGHGLVNMAARATRINARFSLESRPNRGTCITIELPTEDCREHREV